MNLYNQYNHILEYIPKENVCMQNIINESLIKDLLDFLNTYNLTNILISLSGGVDSMVLFNILHHIKEYNLLKLNIYLCHIDYNNRPESNDERDFLIEYCSLKGYELKYIAHDFTRDELKRDIYEKKTNQLRYGFYETLMKQFDLQGVLLAHHKDDVVENIFNNIMRGNREITDLVVIKEMNVIMNVPIYRPFLHKFKNSIYDYANTYQIPYFLDSTPDWSCRGKMRRKIFPSCIDCYGNNYKNNLLQLGQESEQINNIFQTYILNDLIKDIYFENNNFTIKKQEIIKEKYVLKKLIIQIFHKYKLEGLKLKIIDLILENYDKNSKLCMSKYYTIEISTDFIKFITN
jgi:tRNA(Ile)-lysidine synthetase-like protein